MSGATTVITVEPPGGDEYQPQAGDVWAVAVWRPAGASVVAPAGWTELGTTPGVPDPEGLGEVGDLTAWHRMLYPGDGFRPAVFHLAGVVRACHWSGLARPFGLGEPGAGGVMSDDGDPVVLDLSPYLVGGDVPAAARGATGLGQPVAVTFTYRREPAPPVLDGPGYLVVHDGTLAPGAPVLIGRMLDGIAGGVAEWTPGTVGEADGMVAPAEGEPGWYVPAGATHCPRCGDQNWTDTRKCVTCTDGDDASAGGRFAGGWSAGRWVAGQRQTDPPATG